ncbi:hypothetical protein [Enterovibrio coralii]|uniref:PEGA domain-containing protein n=1 Tax=Enterovibrio coralii TaxID=294935 RepID=A0A135I9A7_9GAMM|nr:hypothetical protein [Enterovibrio coralii]KXF82036.1 hypothetical protein ATN88_19670 [Enterovibrio coralii]
MKLIKTALVSVVLFVMGCSSIVNGSTQPLKISATPDAATIRLLNKNGDVLKEQKGRLDYLMKRSTGYFEGADYKLEISYEGYQTQTLELMSTASGWYIGGNIFFGGLIGWLIVDPMTGGMWVIESSNMQETDEMNVTLLKNATEEMMEKAVKVN